MSDPTHNDIERLLWFVHDECRDFITANSEQTISTADNFSRLFTVLADLAVALAGGYREGGLRQ